MTTAQPINESINLVSGAFWGRDPHPELRWIREHSPVYWDPHGQVWGIAGHPELRAASLHPETFSSAGGIRPDSDAMPMSIDMDDPEHMRRRKLVNRGFTPRRIADLEPRVRRACDLILDRVCERGEADLVWDIAAPLPLIMIGELLGWPDDDHQQLLEWSDGMLTALVGGDDPDALESATMAFLGYNEYALRAVAERRERPRDDLLSVLVHAEVDGDRLDDESLVYESLLILIGGDETTRHVISGGAYELMRHPEQRRLLEADPELIPAAVEEMLRWVSPIKNMARTVTRDTEFHGQKLREGDTVLLLYPSANRDARVFEDPDTFDVRRSPNEHLAFGVGTHFCLGNSLARLELRVMFERLLARLPDLEPAGAAPEHRPANFVSGFTSLPVRFTPSR